MKKLLGIIIALAMACAMVTAAFAASGCEASISGATAMAGDEITLYVSVKNSPGIAAASFNIGYDSDAMTYVDVESTNSSLLVEGSTEEGKNPFTLVFLEMSLSDVSGDFAVAAVNFKIADDAAPGTYDIDFTVAEAYNYDETDIPVTAKSSKVVIKSPEPGDANHDCDVTIRDAALILQYIAGWDVTIDTGVADVDCNGDVTIRDAAKILQYIAGWDVTLGEG